MKTIDVVVCMLVSVSICHAAAVKSNGTGGGKWSTPGTWAGGATPKDGDSVIVATGDTVIFDANMSNWTGGVAGVTIDGVLQASTEAGRYCLKTSRDVVLGAKGQLNAGTAEAAYPMTCVFAIDFDGKTSSIECAKGGTVNFYCAQPTTTVVALSEAAAAGATELRGDTNIAGDIWSEGATIRIDDIDEGQDSEERIIAAGGIAADTIRLTESLTKAKIQGAKVILITRNVRIVGSRECAVNSARGSVLGCEISQCAQGIASISGSVISGTVSGATYGISGGSGCTISGVISGCTHGVTISAGCTISGMVSGCSYGIGYGIGHTISGTVSGCTRGVIYSFGNTVSGTISGCNGGFHCGTGTTVGATFSGNRYDLQRVISLYASNTLFDSQVEHSEYNTDNVPAQSYAASYDHDAVPGAFKAWVRGGVIVSDADRVPEGFGLSYKHICQNASTPCFRQEESTVGPNQTLWVEGRIRIADDHSAWAPRLEIIDATADPLVDPKNAALASDAVPVPDGSLADWQSVVVSYTNTGALGKRVFIRCSARRSGGEVHEVWSAELRKAASP